MRVSIIGAGALGKAYGGLLSLSGHDVHYWVRSEYEEIKQKGYFALNFKETGNTTKIIKPKIHSNSDELPVSDLILITLKTTANDLIPSLLSSCRADHSIIVVIQNGMGNEEWISQFTGKSPVICGISMMGAFRKGSIDVEVALLGFLILAAYKAEFAPQVEKVREIFTTMSTPMSIQVQENHRKLRWYKLLWNLPFGALALMYGKTSGVLASEEPTCSMIYDIMSELREIARREGIDIEESTVQNLLERSRAIKDYVPSICHDYNSGRKIEKEYIFDNVLALATKHKVKTPLLHLIDRYLDAITKA